jgi:hypothetical protein
VHMGPALVSTLEVVLRAHTRFGLPPGPEPAGPQEARKALIGGDLARADPHAGSVRFRIAGASTRGGSVP